MSKRGAATAHITPAALGWRVYGVGATPVEAATLEELVPRLPSGSRIHLSVPTQAALLERLALPSTEKEELEGMVQLHLEKSLPYPVEEVTSGLQTIHTGEEGSTVLAVALHGPLLERLSQPLRDAGKLPRQVTLYALDLAEKLPSGKRVAAIWAEKEQLAIALYEEGRLSWASNLFGTDEATLRNELPGLLLTAEMDGVPTQVEQVVLAADLEPLQTAVGEIFGVPTGVLSLEEKPGISTPDLLPPAWAQAAQGHERSEKLRDRLLYAAMVYLLLLAGAFVYLAWLKRQVQVIDAQVAQIQPAVSSTQARQMRWLSMEPALESKSYPIELLFLVNRNRPGEVHITHFSATPREFVVEGEAPNAAQAIDFAEKLRGEKELADFQFDAGPPKILPNEHAQYRIFGKL